MLKMGLYNVDILESNGERKMQMTIKPSPGMYFSAIRDRDDKVFTGQIAAVKVMGQKGKMIVVKLTNTGKYASIYLDDCSDYSWDDFPIGV
jgi:hypothetical protein